jgi:BirA family biotin operon repressor/biotin-[acetyl-CoA-carboxylase] ligase
MSTGWPPAWRLAEYDTLPSTQDAALEAAQNDAPDRVVVIAACQTAGRGRNARMWQAPQGNLNFSALLRPDRATTAGFWPLLAGLALHDAIAQVLPMPQGLMLKWPNDLLLHGAKLAGILVDSAMAANGVPAFVVIGIGVNIATAPGIPGRATACLAEYGAAMSPKTLAAALVGQIDRWVAEEFATIRAAWLTRAHPVGTPLAVNSGQARIKGDFAGLSADGALLLSGHPGPITVGDIQLAQAPCFSS